MSQSGGLTRQSGRGWRNTSSLSARARGNVLASSTWFLLRICFSVFYPQVKKFCCIYGHVLMIVRLAVSSPKSCARRTLPHHPGRFPPIWPRIIQDDPGRHRHQARPIRSPPQEYGFYWSPGGSKELNIDIGYHSFNRDCLSAIYNVTIHISPFVDSSYGMESTYRTWGRIQQSWEIPFYSLVL